MKKGKKPVRTPIPETSSPFTTPVREIFQGQPVWEGDVEVFSIKGHPKASQCYAWAHETDNKGKRYVVVLELPPVDSAQAAVKAAIVEQYRSKA